MADTLQDVIQAALNPSELRSCTNCSLAYIPSPIGQPKRLGKRKSASGFNGMTQARAMTVLLLLKFLKKLGAV